MQPNKNSMTSDSSGTTASVNPITAVTPGSSSSSPSRSAGGVVPSVTAGPSSAPSSSGPARSRSSSPRSSTPRTYQKNNNRNNHDSSNSVGSSSSSLSAPPGRELCGYLHRICLQPRLEGFEYCIRHILWDKSAPFKQCSYIHPQTSKRCPNAARKTERKDSILCPWHIKKLCLKRRQRSRQDLQGASQGTQDKKSFVQLMKELEQYCPEEHEKKRRGDPFWVKQGEDDVNPTASDELRAKIAEAAANHNDSDDDPIVENTLRGDIMDSDSESIDSDQEDPLKHAGVYTAEEVSLILSDKMHRLQKLYIQQFKHLKFLLRERYRKYCVGALTSGALTGGTTSDRDSSSALIPSFSAPEEEEFFNALKKYHRYKGKEALLKRQARERRKALAEGTSYQPPQYPTCIFESKKSGESEKCTNQSLPCTHYCSKHILYDVHQVLFRPCAEGTPPCLTPVIAFQHKNACLAHKYFKTSTLDVKKITGQEDKDDGLGQIAASTEPELFQSIDDISSLALDNVVPSTLFGLDQFGDLGSADLLQ